MDRLLKAARGSGSLNLSNRSIRDVPNEVYRSLDAVGDDEKWWEAVELQKLILADNNIEVLREDLRNLPQLTGLSVSSNKLTQLPSALGELPMLKSLDVSFNSIQQLPEEIGSATSLAKTASLLRSRGLDTLNPVLIIGDKLMLIGDYEETIGTCLVFAEEGKSDFLPTRDVGPVLHEETRPSEANLFSGKCIIDPNQSSRKQVKPMTRLHKILEFRLATDDDTRDVTTEQTSSVKL